MLWLVWALPTDLNFRHQLGLVRFPSSRFAGEMHIAPRNHEVCSKKREIPCGYILLLSLVVGLCGLSMLALNILSLDGKFCTPVEICGISTSDLGRAI